MVLEPDIDHALERAIRQAVLDYVKEVAERETLEAQKRIEQAVRMKVGEIACTVLTKVTFERIGRDLKIWCQFDST